MSIKGILYIRRARTHGKTLSTVGIFRLRTLLNSTCVRNDFLDVRGIHLTLQASSCSLQRSWLFC